MPRRAYTKNPSKTQQGFVLIALVALLVMGALAFLVSNLSPEFVQAYRQRQTDAVLMQAREALIGYALQYRDKEASQGRPDRMYGYLPLPDLGSSRNNNTGCGIGLEGCDAAYFLGNTFDARGIGPTVAGRFPWRTLGTGPLRDSNGECLWLIVSSLHSRIQRSSPPPILPPMNWDTLGQLDIVVANGTTALQSTLASAHDRPIAIIFSPGPPLAGQDRSKNPTSTDDVSECGGNYDAKNYLDPANTALGGITNYLAGSNNANGATGDSDPSNDPDTPKALSIQGVVQRQSDGKLWPGNCPSGASCAIAANDKGLALTTDTLFGAIRKNANFRTDINSMLDRMVGCLRDQVAAGGSFTPVAIADNAPDDKLAGHLPSSSCYDDNQNPLGYYSHYQEMVFAAKPNIGTLTVNDDSSCAGVLLFSNQRNSIQRRISTTDKTTPFNYLENVEDANNLTSFTDIGTKFTGEGLLNRSPPQTVAQDIVRCIPSTASLTTVTSPNLTANQQLVAYDPSTRMLTLGKADVTNTTAGAENLFGCAWLADTKKIGSGFRTYFQFSFNQIGNTGFVFAAIDAENNPDLPCGMAGSHLGYSGNNGLTSKLMFPKIGIEFDQSRNAGFSSGSGETSTNAGRNDPCGTSSCGANTITGYNSHAAIVYWGHEIANSSDRVTRPDNDDNVHGFPAAESLSSTRQPPKNPDTSPGINLVNLRAAGRIFHVRIEVTPTRSIDITAAENSKTSMQTKVWILANSATVANQIAAMKNTTRPMAQLYPGFTETLSDSAAVFDVAGATCSTIPPVGSCPTNQTCGSDNVCYRQGMQSIRLGFTGSQRTQAQEVTISNIFTTWLP
ncbi:MAG: hypothetical protein Q7J21_00795 [Rugosibacter sp.]|nr:hypothetical protein [Rugosibacter sp.]